MAVTAHKRMERQQDVVHERLAYRPVELAGMVGLSTKAIYRAVERGELEAAKVANGTRLLIPAQSAELWLVRNLVAPRAAQKPHVGRNSRRAARPLGEALQRLSAPRHEE
jgi:hypothetical protein